MNKLSDAIPYIIMGLMVVMLSGAIALLLNMHRDHKRFVLAINETIGMSASEATEVLGLPDRHLKAAELDILIWERVSTVSEADVAVGTTLDGGLTTVPTARSKTVQCVIKASFNSSGLIEKVELNGGLKGCRSMSRRVLARTST